MAERNDSTTDEPACHRGVIAWGLFALAALSGVALTGPGFELAIFAAAVAAAALLSSVLTRRRLLRRLQSILPATAKDAGTDPESALRAVAGLSQKLRLSQQRLEDFTHSTSDWLWEMDHEFRFVHASERFYEASGLTASEFIGRRQDREAQRHPESDEWTSHLKDLSAGRPFRNFTYAEPHPDGGERWFRLSGTPVHDADGRLTGYRGTGTDVSAEMNAREEAVDTTLRFLEAIETVADGIAFWDAEDRFQLCNKAFRRQAGNAASLLVRGTRFEDYARGMAESGKIQISDNRKEEWVQNRIREHRNPPNAFESYRDGRWYLIRDDGSPSGNSVTVSTDITEVKQRQQELQMMTDAVPMLLGYVDSEQRFQMVNKAFEDWLGLTRRQIKGQPLQDILDEETFEAMRGHIAAALSGKAVRFEAALPYPDATATSGLVSTRHIEATFTPDFNNPGTAIGFYVAASDVTERKLAEQQLHQSQKIQAVGKLTGGIAHDFNNLLAIIVGSLNILDERIDGDFEHKLVGSSLRAARRGADLTQRLLAFGRRQALASEITNGNDLIGGMEDMLRRTLGVTAEIETIFAEKLWSMNVDRNQMENAILNLSINARDAMPEGGHLTIETANVVLDRRYTARHEGVEPGRYVMVTVSDTGTGMSPDVVEQAVEPFFTTKDVGQGSGLGLSMIYGFVRQSGGHMRIHSEVGAGTVVRLYLPAGGEDALAVESTGDMAEQARSRGETILVIEDDPEVLAVTTSMLDRLGYDVLTAASGRAALGIVEAHTPFDLLFTDVFLSDGPNGPDIAREIKRRRPGMPVLFTSGYADNQISADGVLEDGVQLIAKPFELKQLALRLRDILDGERGPALSSPASSPGASAHSN